MTSPKYRDQSIPDETYAAIGKIIRACAELEDMTFLHLCGLAATSESKMAVLVGKTGIGTLRTTALLLAEMHSEDALAAHQAVYNEGFTNLFSMRNTLAHGTFMGRDDEKKLAFLTSEILDPVGDASTKLVRAYSDDEIAEAAQVASRAMPIIEKQLQIEELRLRRVELPLGDRPKGRRRRKKGTKRAPRPRPSVA